MSAGVRPIDASDAGALRAFFDRVPEGDRTFFREDVLDTGVIDSWLADEHGHRYVAVDGDDIVGYLALLPGVAWSAHVGELRLIVDPTRRRQGIGRLLARHALMEALQVGLRKLVVEVVATQEPTVALFNSLGFEAEGLLADHVCAGDGDLRDLLVLSHFVDANWSSMETVGIDDAVGS